MPSAIDITGERFGRLVAERFERYRGRERLWRCRCDCGQTTLVTVSSLRQGNTASCGCLRLERVTRHGLYDSPEYGIWKAARTRCHKPGSQGWKNYGARGIRMCDEWRHDFAAFYRDMGPRPTARHSLDRVDNDGPYAAGNCRWATRTQQATNRRGNHKLTWNGETLTITEWARRCGSTAGAIASRLDLGWPLDEALTKPPDRRGNRHDLRKVTFRGITKPLTTWAVELGISATSLTERLARMPLERAMTMKSHQHSNGHIFKRHAQPPT